MPASLKDFEAVFPSLVSDLTTTSKSHNLPTNALQWFENSLNANTIGGKCNRGLSVVDTASLLKSDPSLTTPSNHSFKSVAYLGWLVELLQAFFLVSDDIMDSSITRRGQPCWYRQKGVGMIAINDAFMLESAIYVILRKHFRDHPDYLGMLELFQDMTFRTEMGQQCDLLTAPEDSVDLERFSMQKYWFIVRYKTAFYSFYLPVALALHWCQLATPRNLKTAEEVLVPMGEYFQAQDDYLDCFADATVLGKVGTDIKDNKCSWLVNQALERATPEQKQRLAQNYGRKDDEAERQVKALYKEIRLNEVYQRYEEDAVTKIRGMIERVDESEGLKKEVFEEFLKKIYKRTR
ncbi:MAG: hypothetical protein Q9162_000357 [Coniocarpon cinnabarinum]